MAHDFDFKRVPRGSDSVDDFRHDNSHQSTQHPSFPTHKTVSHRRRGIVPLVIAVIGLAAAGVGAYYYSTLPAKETPPAATSQEEAVPKTDTTSETDRNVFKADEALSVQVYQSGAGTEVIDQTVALLKDKGYTVENLGSSQFEYDKTYIWYTAQYEAKAKEIGALMTNRVVSYKESQNSGLFDILIYLGKQ